MTTRTLVLLRHAKAENPTAVADIDRPLSARGHADAAAAGAWLAEECYVPDRVLCSTALRTRETWHGVSKAFSVRPQVSFERSVYAADPEELLELVRAVHDTAGTVVVVGHNPGLSQLCAMLDDTADPKGLATAGIAILRYDGAWVECGPGVTTLIAEYTARGRGH